MERSFIETLESIYGYGDDSDRYLNGESNLLPLILLIILAIIVIF
jgi:hypothetical protein